MTMTRHWWSAAVVLAALAVTGASTARAAQAISAEGLKALAAHLRIDAESWIKGELSDRDFRATAIKLKSVTYDNKSVEALVPLIRGVTGRSKPQALFVANRLLRPLLMAKRDPIKKALSTVKQIHRSAGKYKPMPTNLRKVSKMVVPPKPMSSDAVVAAIAASQKGVGERRQKIRDVKLWNEEVHMLKLALYELLIFAEDSREDRELLMMLQRDEQAGLYGFIDICTAVRKHVRSLDRTRAQAYHKGFASLGARLWAKKGRYARHFEFRAERGRLKSSWKDEYTGILLLKTANLLAPVAGKPAVVVPSTKRVEEYIKRTRR